MDENTTLKEELSATKINYEMASEAQRAADTQCPELVVKMEMLTSELRAANSDGARYKAESQMKDNPIRILEANMTQQIAMLKEAASLCRDHSRDLAQRPKKAA